MNAKSGNMNIAVTAPARDFKYWVFLSYSHADERSAKRMHAGLETYKVPKPLVGTRGHLMDHVALSVGNLDAWVAKLKGEGVKFLERPYRLGDTRAVMIEGPSREAIELVEVK